jgi:predicted TIM-barrel fold metal-dependent hydrolase
VWGSDWPHVRAEGVKKEEEVEGKKVDLANELGLLKAALSEENWRRLMVENPGRLFT